MTESAQSTEELLAGVSLFSGLSRRQLKRLYELGKETRHPAGQQIAAEGMGALAFHLITDGEASVSAKGSALRRLHVGDYLGEVSLIDGKGRSATVTAVTPLRTFAIPHHVFSKLLDDEPEFARGLLLMLCARLREAEAKLPG